MTAFSLHEIAACTDGILRGCDLQVAAVGADTRALHGGELFVALRGPIFDAHEFVSAAADGGAVAAMVSRPVETVLPLVEVADTRIGLGRLASAWRERANPFLVGVTGSNGKTTLKEMIAAILAQRGPVLATHGNLNNDIGLPLTLTRLQNHAYAVIEMGANHAGEIDYLSRIARPDVAVLNNAGRAHLEGFGSPEGVARAKAEIINGLKPGGVFVYNADDVYAGLWRERAHGTPMTGFGLGAAADVGSPRDAVQMQWTADGFHMAFSVRTPQGEFDISLPLAGEHNRMNALAAVAACMHAGADPAAMRAGLAGLRPVPGRLCPVPGRGGSLLVDDSYNANPESVLAAIRLLAGAPGERLLVLGDLAELGPGAVDLMAELGHAARDAGIDRLYTCGGLSAAASAAFGPGAMHLADRDELTNALGPDLNADSVVLVKGSRAARMEHVVAALAAGEAAPC